MRDICGIIATRQYQIIGERPDGYLAECILKGVHGYEPHVFCTPEGGYYAWEDDMECDCCEPGEADRCTVYWEIEKSEVQEYQKGGPPRK